MTVSSSLSDRLLDIDNRLQRLAEEKESLLNLLSNSAWNFLAISVGVILEEEYAMSNCD